jgi:hypothetical protein
MPSQKNGAIVRQVVGYDRLVGECAYRQLTELYRALRRSRQLLLAEGVAPVEEASELRRKLGMEIAGGICLW